jgi:hypothetical protein
VTEEEVVLKTGKTGTEVAATVSVIVNANGQAEMTGIGRESAIAICEVKNEGERGDEGKIDAVGALLTSDDAMTHGTLQNVAGNVVHLVIV